MKRVLSALILIAALSTCVLADPGETGGSSAPQSSPATSMMVAVILAVLR